MRRGAWSQHSGERPGIQTAGRSAAVAVGGDSSLRLDDGLRRGVRVLPGNDEMGRIPVGLHLKRACQPTCLWAADGTALAGLGLLVWRNLHGRSSFPSMPGHWLMIVWRNRLRA